MTARRWACCAIAVCAGLFACGGLAADGVEPEASGLGGSTSTNEPTGIGPIRETCADNPLLAECQTAGTGSISPPDAPAPGPDEEPLYIAAARNVLVSYCGGCHGPPLTEAQASGTINYIDDWDQLVQAGLIQRCSPRRSRIIQVMRSGEMPPPESGLPPVTDAEVDFVANAIQLDCDGR